MKATQKHRSLHCVIIWKYAQTQVTVYSSSRCYNRNVISEETWASLIRLSFCTPDQGWSCHHVPAVLLIMVTSHTSPPLAIFSTSKCGKVKGKRIFHIELCTEFASPSLRALIQCNIIQKEGLLVLDTARPTGFCLSTCDILRRDNNILAKSLRESTVRVGKELCN